MATAHEEKRKDPSTKSMAYEAMASKWDMVEDLLGGTDTMREAGEKHLPIHAHESFTNYNVRLKSTTLYNMFELTLESLVGRPFGDPIRLNADVPASIREYAKDIDLQGNDITVFMRQVFEESWAKGFAHVMVDMPPLSEEEMQGRTLANDIEDNRRPYLVFIKPENLIFATSEFVGGREALTHIRILEEKVVQDGFAETVIEQIRVIEPGFFQVYEKRKVKKSGKVEWVVIEQGDMDTNRIQLFTFYAGKRKGLHWAKPPLEDMAFLNVRHWQSTSDQANILTVARFPILAMSGAVDHTGDTLVIGPRQMLGTKDPQGRFYYVEHTGKAIAAGRQDLQDLEAQMATYGAEFLKRKSGNVAATVAALSSSESVSILQDATVRFVNFVGEVLDAMAEWEGLDSGGTVNMRTDFNLGAVNPEILKTLLEARKNGDLSREDFLEQLKELQVLNDEFDPFVNFMRLMSEVMNSDLDPTLARSVQGDIFGGDENDGKKTDPSGDDDPDDEE